MGSRTCFHQANHSQTPYLRLRCQQMCSRSLQLCMLGKYHPAPHQQRAMHCLQDFHLQHSIATSCPMGMHVDVCLVGMHFIPPGRAVACAERAFSNTQCVICLDHLGKPLVHVFISQTTKFTFINFGNSLVHAYTCVCISH